MTPKILLVNPPIYDFAAYDFWLKLVPRLEAAESVDWLNTYFAGMTVCINPDFPSNR